MPQIWDDVGGVPGRSWVQTPRSAAQSEALARANESWATEQGLNFEEVGLATEAEEVAELALLTVFGPEVAIAAATAFLVTEIATHAKGKKKRKALPGVGPAPKQPKPDGQAPSFNRRSGKSSPILTLDFFIN